MSRKRYQNKNLPGLLREYADGRGLEFFRYSEYHMRLIDPGFTTVDIWTSEKYWVKETNYYEQTEKRIIERQSETGWVPSNNPELTEFLDGLFYAAEKG